MVTKKSKTWALSKTNWLAIILAALTGIVAGITEAKGSFPLPSWLVALAGILSAVLIPALRSVTSERLAGGAVVSGAKGIAAALAVCAVAFMATLGGASATGGVPIKATDAIEVMEEVVQPAEPVQMPIPLEGETPLELEVAP